MSQPTRPTLTGTVGMVTSTHWLASAAGMSVLERGGNAADAAVATGLVLHVVEPHLNGLGGDVPVIGQVAGADAPFVLCGQGTAPAAATPEAFAALGLDHVPGTGVLPAVVPGAWGAWLDLLARYGTWTVRAVAEPAIGYARHGHPLLPQAAATIARVADTFRRDWPTSAAIYLPADRPPAAGQRFDNPDLADTLELLVAAADGHPRLAGIEQSRRAFYQGFVAEAIGRFVAGTDVPDSTGRAHRGLLTADDLAAWQVREEPAVTAEVLGRTVATTGPWGQGPALLLQLRLIDAEDLADTDPGSAELAHLTIEAAKLALADRDAWFGDPDHTDVPMDVLLSAAYTAKRHNLIGSTASDELRPGPAAGPPRLPTAVLTQVAADRAAGRSTPQGTGTGTGTPGIGTPGTGTSTPGTTHAGRGEPTFTDPDGTVRGDTCHLDVVDRWGTVISATPSGGWLQSSPAIPGLGFALPTRGQMFWLEPGLPASLGPGRRPRTTLSPTLVLRDGVAELACGTPGGDQQTQWQVPFLIRHLVHGQELQDAVDAPAWHTTHLVSSFDPRTVEVLGVRAEASLGSAVIDELRRRGHEVTVTEPWSLGRLTAAGRRGDGTLHAAATARSSQAYAAGR